MKILFTEVNEQWQQSFFNSKLAGHELLFVSNEDYQQHPDQFSDVEALSVFVQSPVTAEDINTFPNLKFICTRSTGYDHIDLESAKAKGIPVSNVPFYGENTVAEHTMALLLALSRKLRPSFERIEEGQFDYEGLRGWDLKGKRLGIIGGGHIGMHVARMAKGFEMDVVVFDLFKKPELAESIGFTYVEMNELLTTADVITLHMPLNSSTHHTLNADQFRQMKNSVYIINTARGGLINTNALLTALIEGRVAGAALDVLEEEDALKDSNPQAAASVEQSLLEANKKLMEMDQVLITPHNAFNSQEAVERIMMTTVENITAFVSGAPQNQVGK